MPDSAAPGANRIRVWDVPTRLVHWAMVLLVAASWWTAEAERMDWHRYSGYALLALVGFRIYWGFAGSSTARFSQFVSGPRVILGYLKGAWVVAPGHNPVGALSAIVMLSLLLAQIALGLFAVDVDGIESGPLSTYVSFEAGRACARLHETLFDVLLVMIALHVAAVLFYVLYKKENLVGAMVHGRREYAANLPPVRSASVLRLLIGIALAGALTWMVARAFQFA